MTGETVLVLLPRNEAKKDTFGLELRLNHVLDLGLLPSLSLLLLLLLLLVRDWDDGLRADTKSSVLSR